MIRWLSLLSSMMLLSVLLMGCSTSAPTQSQLPVDSKQTLPVVNKNLGQYLPISAVATVPNGTKIELEVARTEQQQEMGLMYRPALATDRGMLFQFSSPVAISFWMKNTPLSLDIVFIRKGVVNYIAASVPPCVTQTCPSYGPRTLVDQVIELHSGRAAELGLKLGDHVKIDSLNAEKSRL